LHIGPHNQTIAPSEFRTRVAYLPCETMTARSRLLRQREIELTADRELLGIRSSWSF